MRKRSQVNHLVKRLSRDPRLRRVIHKAKLRQKNGTGKIEGLGDLFLLSLAVASRFVSKRKARTLDELMEIVYLLVVVSLILKENVFDRPEVKEFFSQNYKRVSSVYREYVDRILSRIKKGEKV